MEAKALVVLDDRGVLSVKGPDAAGFLQALISNDIGKVGQQRAIYASLLTPQGKFLHDFFVAAAPDGDGVLLDCEGERRDDLLRRLAMYRLRARVELADISDAHDVVAAPGAHAPGDFGLDAAPASARPHAGGVIFTDPRLAAMGVRAILPAGTGLAALGVEGFATATVDDYRRLRLRHGLPDGSRDIVVGKYFPLECGFDELHAIDYDKGCYVGQELTARIHHRGTVRKRLMPVVVDGPLPEPGTAVLRGGREVGEIRTGADDRAIALIPRRASRERGPGRCRLYRRRRAGDTGQAGMGTVLRPHATDIRRSPGGAERATAMTTVRCPWADKDPLLIDYHDSEWGVPEHDDRALFEKLVLDGFQAGLSWLIVLKKRDNFRRAFDGFDPEKIARYDARKVAALMNDPGIVRNRAKIEGARASARAYLRILEDGGSFDRFLWQFTDGRTLRPGRRRPAELPAETAQSRAMSKALRQRGFKFVGPTICYAFMQAIGMVNDHVVSCFRYPVLTERMIRACGEGDLAAVHAVINDAARAYRSVIPADCWREPYMPFAELEDEIAAGVAFLGYEEGGALIGVMGTQPVADVMLIRHAYVASARRRAGIGSALLTTCLARHSPAGADRHLGRRELGHRLLPQARFHGDRRHRNGPAARDLLVDPGATGRDLGGAGGSALARPAQCQPAYLTTVTACVASRPAIPPGAGRKSSGDYGRGPRRRGRAPGGDPKGGAVHDRGEICRLPLDQGEIGDRVERDPHLVHQAEAVGPQGRVGCVDRHPIEEGIDTRPQAGEGGEGRVEGVRSETVAEFGGERGEILMQRPFFVLHETGGIDLVAGIDRAVLLLLDGEDVGGTAIGGQQVFAVLAGQESLERLDPRGQPHEIVLAGPREHRRDQIVAHATLAQMHLEPAGEEAEQLVGKTGVDGGAGLRRRRRHRQEQPPQRGREAGSRAPGE